MTRRIALVLSVLVASLAVNGQVCAQGLTDADVARAIALGKQKRASTDC
jgi:hypothetical protein